LKKKTKKEKIAGEESTATKKMKEITSMEMMKARKIFSTKRVKVSVKVSAKVESSLRESSMSISATCSTHG
jgi:formylmethanofuran dehydrogenase subunit E